MAASQYQISSIELKGASGWLKELAALANSPWAAASFLFFLSLIIYLPEADRPPHVDELYHILAARGVLAEGEPSIADGLYTRAELFTRLVAASMALLGDNPLSARLPSLLAGGLLVVAVFLWTRAVAGAAAAWIAAGFLCLVEPLSAQLFLWARFYVLHGLAFWLGAIGVYALATRPWSRPRALLIASGCLIAFALAVHLQKLTLIGLAGLGAWLAVAVALPWLWRRLATPVRRWGFLAAVAALGVAGAALALEVDPLRQALQALWAEYRWAALHSIEQKNAVWFYHFVLLKHYQTLWSVFPFLVLLAVALRPQPALFCSVVLGVALALLSFGGMKGHRYLFFILPFLFVLWGIALASGAAAVARWVVATADRAVAAAAPGLPAARPARWALIALGVLFVIGANGATTKAVLRPAGLIASTGSGGGIALSQWEDGTAWQASGNAWKAASAPLQPWLRQASLLVTGNEEYTLYYIGDYDVLLSLNRYDELIHETGRGGAFPIDWRTGRPVIGTAESLARLLDCYPDGLILTHANQWGKHQAYTMDPATADLILDRTEPVELPRGIPLRVFRWQNAGPPAAGAACPALSTRAKRLAAANGGG